MLIILFYLGARRDFHKNIPTTSIFQINYYKIEQNLETILSFDIIWVLNI